MQTVCPRTIKTVKNPKLKIFNLKKLILKIKKYKTRHIWLNFEGLESPKIKENINKAILQLSSFKKYIHNEIQKKKYCQHARKGSLFTM